MSNPKLVGITGGIGSGKTTVATIFRALGIPVYFADSRSKILTNTDPHIIKKIKQEFGKNSYTNESINRDYISSIVFKNPDKLDILNSIVHPKVADDFKSWIKKQDASYILKEAALLFEAGSAQELDKTIVVVTPLPLRISRISKRDPFRSREEILNIISRQSNDEYKIKHSDYTINNGEGDLLIPQVLRIHQSLIS